MREGAILYLDEVVEARKDTTVVLHPLADDRRILPIERTGELIAAPPEFMLVISYNPGYQNLLKGLPSTRQRFTALTLDYPEPAVERAILEREGRATPEIAARLVQLAQALRRLTDHDLEETASTRLLVMAARLVASGPALRDACAAVVDALSDDHDTLRALDEVVRAVVGDGTDCSSCASAAACGPSGASAQPLAHTQVLQRRRRWLQLSFFAVFLLAPAFNLLRFDLNETQLWVLGFRWSLGIDAFVRGEATAAQTAWSIIWRGILPVLTLVIGFLAVAYHYGRLYCGWLCPHFSLVELLNDLLHRATGRLSVWDTSPRPPWPQRRQALVARLPGGMPGVWLRLGHHAAHLPAASRRGVGQPGARHFERQPGALSRRGNARLHP